VAAGLDPESTEAGAIMSAPLIAVTGTDPLEEVVARMRTCGVRRIPVLGDGRPVGMVSFDDLLVTFGSELAQLADCVAGELQTARTRSQLVRVGDRVRRELEDGIEGVASQARRLGDQVLRVLGREVEAIGERVRDSVRGAGGLRSRSAPTVAALMETEVHTCTPGDTLARAAQLMWEGDCGCAPVVAEDGSGRLVGMLTDRDVCMASWTSGRRLAELPVRDAMATRLCTCAPIEPVTEALERMRAAQVRRLPVVDAEGRLRGILSLADAARAAAGERGPAGAVSAAELGRTLEAICRPRREAEAEPAR